MQRNIWRAAVGTRLQQVSLAYRRSVHISTGRAIVQSKAVRVKPACHLSRCSLSIADHYQTWSFYQYQSIVVDQLETLRKELITIGKKNGMLGRIYVSKEGINAQMTIPESTTTQCQTQVEAALATFEIIPNWTKGFSDVSGPTFRQLQVKVRSQLVADGIHTDMTLPPQHLDPKEWHERLSRRPAIIFDQRNAYESAIGHFEHAITPNVGNFRDSLKALDQVVENLDKNAEIYLYCTGGIRCTRSGSLLKSQGYENVYVLKGGITAYASYVQESSQTSLFKGVNFTFDKRPFLEGAAEKLTNDLIGKCTICKNPTSSYRNCASLPCNALFLQCGQCAVDTLGTCGSQECFESAGIDLRKFGMRNKPVRDLQRGRTREETGSWEDLMNAATIDEIPENEVLQATTRGETSRKTLLHGAFS